MGGIGDPCGDTGEAGGAHGGIGDPGGVLGTPGGVGGPMGGTLGTPGPGGCEACGVSVGSAGQGAPGAKREGPGGSGGARGARRVRGSPGVPAPLTTPGRTGSPRIPARRPRPFPWRPATAAAGGQTSRVRLREPAPSSARTRRYWRGAAGAAPFAIGCSAERRAGPAALIGGEREGGGGKVPEAAAGPQSWRRRPLPGPRWGRCSAGAAGPARCRWP